MELAGQVTLSLEQRDKEIRLGRRYAQGASAARPQTQVAATRYARAGATKPAGTLSWRRPCCHGSLTSSLHLDRHLVELLAQYHLWIYPILFARHLCGDRPGGDSVPARRFASLRGGRSGGRRHQRHLEHTGAECASRLCRCPRQYQRTMRSGRLIGPPAFSGRYRFLKVEHLRRTEEFFARYGGSAVALSRFMPFVRTFAPFVAGVGACPTDASRPTTSSAAFPG